MCFVPIVNDHIVYLMKMFVNTKLFIFLYASHLKALFIFAFALTYTVGFLCVVYLRVLVYMVQHLVS